MVSAVTMVLMTMTQDGRGTKLQLYGSTSSRAGRIRHRHRRRKPRDPRSQSHGAPNLSL